MESALQLRRKSFDSTHIAISWEIPAGSPASGSKNWPRLTTFKDAGAEITLASPKGGQPPDPKSNEPSFQTDQTRRFEVDPLANTQLAQTVRLDSVRQEDFDTVFYPGGHGPGALRHVKTPDGRPFVGGKRVTGFTNSEEEGVGITDVVPFLVEDELKAKGGKFERGEDWGVFIVTDGLLATGQNPRVVFCGRQEAARKGREVGSPADRIIGPANRLSSLHFKVGAASRGNSPSLCPLSVAISSLLPSCAAEWQPVSSISMESGRLLEFLPPRTGSFEAEPYRSGFCVAPTSLVLAATFMDYFTAA